MVNNEVNNPQPKEKVFGYFIDSFGSEHKLIEGLRDKIKPGWEGSLKKKNYENIPSNEAVLDQLYYSKSQFNKLERLMSIHSVKISQEMEYIRNWGSEWTSNFSNCF